MMAGGNDNGTFFGAFDDTTNCGWQQGDTAPGSDPVIRSHIDKVEFSGRTVSVFARFGKKQMNREEVRACMAGDKAGLPKTKSYRMDFLYDGHGYKPSPASVDAVHVFEAR